MRLPKYRFLNETRKQDFLLPRKRGLAYYLDSKNIPNKMAYIFFR